MHRIHGFVILMLVASLAGCSRHTPLSPEQDATGNATAVALGELDRLERNTRPDAAGMRFGGGNAVRVPAGSADALAAALAEAGAHGTVLLESGLHTESGTVEITQPVTLIGEAGAVLESTTDPTVNPGDRLDPALWVHGADQVTIRGLEFRPAGSIGGVGVLLDHSANSNVLLNNIHDYQHPIVLEQADHAKVWRNRVACSPAWQSGGIPSAFGITNVNGDQTLIADNQVTNGLFGIWPCDLGGSVVGNRVSDSFIGIILCKVPAGSMILPDGTATGADQTATGWLVQGNETHANFSVGILAIDGANASQIANNNSHDNGTYDVEMTGDSFRFGFLTPASFNCTFVAGSYPNVRVKNCGNANTVNGGVLVDNSIEPCN